MSKSSSAEIFQELRREANTLSRVQREQREWSLRNFGEHPSWQPLLGAVEELGELAHAHLKASQGIRGTQSEHTAKKIDAVADTIVFLCDYCSCEGIDIEMALRRTWEEVKQRDWTKDKQNAGEAASINGE